jgi:4-cresol dehydrogenase (hydroxylating)
MSAFPDPAPFVLTPDARDELIAIVGREGILLTEEERDTYRDPYWFHEDRRYDSSAVVFPTSTEQVQEIVRVADRHEIPVWTSSQGRNNGYGGPSARVPGSVLISLRKMNRILEVNTELAYAVVEPGVRWLDLYDALHELGDDLLLSVPDIGWGSIIGNSLDNGMTYLPLGADFAAPCGLEVILADGSLLRTGMGAIPDSPSWHVYRRGLGPVLDPLFMQSNYGIVTRMGVWLQRRPKSYTPLYLSIPRDHQLAQAIDIVRELRLDGVIRGVPNIQNLITMGAQFPEHMGMFPGADPTWSEDRLDSLADRTGIGRWGVRTALWGDPEVNQIHLRVIREAWSAIEGSRVDDLGTFTKQNWADISTFMQRISAGVPSLDMVDIMPDWVGHVGFSPIVPLQGAEVVRVIEQIKDLVIERTGTNFVCAIFPTNDRSAMIVSAMSFDRTDETQVKATFDTVKQLIADLGEQGYGEYRAHLDAMDLASDVYSFGDHAYRRFTDAIKDAVDPKGILSPGRHGVWPAKYRDS